MDVTGRALRLLTLLQERRVWTAQELSERLEVTPRSVRRDVDRLRELGYPIDAERGAGGGYRLASGSAMPPLVLDDDEVVAIAVSLRSAAGGTVEGLGEASVRAMAKLDQVIPVRLRARVEALRSSTVAIDAGTAPVSPNVLLGLSLACRDEVRVRFGYRPGGSGATPAAEPDLPVRHVEPYRLVATGRRWYLVAYDLDREDWRSFRLDRLDDLHVTTFRFAPRDAPDPAEFVARGTSREAYRYQARVRVYAAAAAVRDRMPPTVALVVPEERGPDDREGATCLLTTGADTLSSMAWHLGSLPWRFEVLEPPELRVHLADLGDRLRAAAGPPPGSSPTGPSPIGPWPTESATATT